jgi:hypothetical protein
MKRSYGRAKGMRSVRKYGRPRARYGNKQQHYKPKG